MSAHAESGSGGEIDRDAREQAVQRIKKRRDLATHLVTYLVVNAAFWGLWAISGGGSLWPAWISGLWAIGLLLNAWDVYARRPIGEREIQREVERAREREEGS